MTLMTRKDAYDKRGLTEEQVDDIYEKWILKQEELHNAQKEK